MKIREQYPLFLAQCVILKSLWVLGDFLEEAALGQVSHMWLEYVK